MKGTAGWMVVVVAALALGCERNKSDRAPAAGEPKRDAPEVERCVRALQQATTTGHKLRTIAAGCKAACPGLAELANTRRAAVLDEESLWKALERCDVVCDGVALEPESSLPDRLPELARRCSLSHFGLPDGYQAYLSDDSVVVARIAAWLDGYRNQMSAGLRADLDRSTRLLHVPLPPPVSISGRYSLPSSDAAQPFSSNFYLVVSKSEVSAAAVPVARMSDAALELRPVPGGRPPGQLLPAGKESLALGSLVELWDEHHPGGDAPSYTYLADQTIPVSRVVSLARKLGHRRFRLAVSGLAAREHSVEVVLQSANAAPVVTLADGELRTSGATSSDVVAELRAALVQMAPTSLVELRCASETSVSEVVRALDRLASARALQAALVPIEP